MPAGLTGDVRAAVVAERREQVELLTGPTAARMSLPRFLLDLGEAGGRFDRMAVAGARRDDVGRAGGPAARRSGSLTGRDELSWS